MDILYLILAKRFVLKLLSFLAYVGELHAIIEAVQKWRHCLLDKQFIIETDQRSLKELMNQVIQTPEQHFI